MDHAASGSGLLHVRTLKIGATVAIIIAALTLLALMQASLRHARATLYPPSFAPLSAPRAAAMPNVLAPSAVDLTAEITLDPAVPGIGQEVTIGVTLYNNGNSAASGAISVYLYVDPSDRPPTPSTTGFPLINVPGLPNGGSLSGTRTHTFTTEGCDHVVYAWVDRDDQISESNEDNNLIVLPVCVGVECAADSYEEDNICSAAGWLTESAAQARSFCHATNDTLPDVDWIKFTAFQGLTYTLGTTNAGAHADPRVAIYGSCGATELAGPANSVEWTAPSNGLYYAKIEQNEETTTGPLTAYSLTLTSQSGATDDYEPDDRCTTARDITTDGTRQTHRFQTPGDQDWLKFTIKTGENFIVVADNAATGVKPLVTLFTSCDQVPANNSLGITAAQVEDNATTDQTYYARVNNEDPNSFGSDKKYDLRVIASACVADNFEQDDVFGQAKALAANGNTQTHNVCPASDADWVKLVAEKDKIYVLQTQNLAFAADTVLELYDTNGTSLLSQNDDYGYGSASRITWQAPASGTYFAKVTHNNSDASGPNTQYDISFQPGVCNPDDQEGNDGNNGPGDALAINTNGQPQQHNFCADALRADLGDQDWVSFQAVPGGKYDIRTTGLGNNSDTVLELIGPNGETMIQRSDDAGPGRSTVINFTATAPGTYFVRSTQFNTNVLGGGTDYQLSVFGDIPPTPTPTLPPTPTPTPTPTAPPTPEPSTVETLLLVNRSRMESIYGVPQTNTLMDKLFTLADREDVQGAVIPIEGNTSVAAAYTAWTADSDSLRETAKANAVASAVRNLIMSFLDSAPNVNSIIIVGDDRVIPYRRISEGITTEQENTYVPDVTANSTIAAALAEDMILTDDYYADREFSVWKDRQKNEHEIYIPDFAISRLIETPAEIRGTIDQFIADQVINTQNVLVTGYDFVQDSAQIMSTLFKNDTLPTEDSLIGPIWPGDTLRTLQLAANPRYDVQAINGHSTHIAAGVPDLKDIRAGEIVTATADFAGTLVFSLGCHAGLNDPGLLDLPQAFMQRRATYVGQTGFGWGGGGVVYSENLMRNFTRELLRDTEAEVGVALKLAKQKYWSKATVFNNYDAKVLMQTTLYGLSMMKVTSGGTLSPEDDFPSAKTTIQPPSSLGGVNEGTFSYSLPGSFGSFGGNSTTSGTFLDLDDNVIFSAGEPVQPTFFADASAPAAGTLRGAVFLGGTYSETVGFDPVIARPHNEYVADTTEPSFSAEGWYPAIPFSVRAGDTISGTGDSIVMSLGQFNGGGAVNSAQSGGTERIFSQMSFGTYYSQSPDRNAADIQFVDGILDTTSGEGTIKVETTDSSGIQRVVVAYTGGQSQWLSKNLILDTQTQKWTGTITGTATTQYFVQVVDGAGNVAINDNKGRYYQLQPPLQLAEGRALERDNRVFLPSIRR